MSTPTVHGHIGRLARSAVGASAVALLLCGCLLAPSDPVGLGLALTYRNGNYYMQFEGHCTYPAMEILVYDETTNKTFWEAKLRRGSTAKLLVIGKSDQVVSEKTPFQGMATVNRIRILMTNNEVAWDNTFDLSALDEGLNGGEEYNDKDTTLTELNKDVSC